MRASPLGIRQYRGLAAIDQLPTAQPGQVSQGISTAFTLFYIAKRVVLKGHVEGVEDIHAFPGIPEHDQAGQTTDGVVCLLGVCDICVGLGFPIEEVGQVLACTDAGRIDDPVDHR